MTNNEPGAMSEDVFLCSDCGRRLAAEESTLCRSCVAWRTERLAKLDARQQVRLRPRHLLRGMTGVEFGEALADVVKAVERSRR